MILLAQGLMVYIVNDGGKIISCRCGNNNVLRARVDMSLRLCLRGIEAGALKNNVYAQLAPRKLRGVGLRVNLDLFSVNRNGILAVGNRVGKCLSALGGILL